MILPFLVSGILGPRYSQEQLNKIDKIINGYDKIIEKYKEMSKSYDPLLGVSYSLKDPHS